MLFRSEKFEQDVRATADRIGVKDDQIAKSVANWLVNVVMGEANNRNLIVNTANFSPTANSAILSMVSDGTLSNSTAKIVFIEHLDTGQAPELIVETKGLKQTSDTGAIDAVIAEILAANADKVAQFKAGKEALFGFFVGQTMKAMGGKANPGVVNELLRNALV